MLAGALNTLCRVRGSHEQCCSAEDCVRGSYVQQPDDPDRSRLRENFIRIPPARRRQNRFSLQKPEYCTID